MLSINVHPLVIHSFIYSYLSIHYYSSHTAVHLPSFHLSVHHSFSPFYSVILSIHLPTIHPSIQPFNVHSFVHQSISSFIHPFIFSEDGCISTRNQETKHQTWIPFNIQRSQTDLFSLAQAAPISFFQPLKAACIWLVCICMVVIYQVFFFHRVNYHKPSGLVFVTPQC